MHGGDLGPRDNAAVNRRFQFSLAKLFMAASLFCVISFCLSKLVSSCRSNSVSVWSYFAFCAIGGCIAAILTMYHETMRDALLTGVLFFVLAVFAIPLVFAGLLGLCAVVRSVLLL